MRTKDKKKYYAFKNDYKVLANELRTLSGITVSSAFNNTPPLERKIMTIEAIWDTGATNTVIREDLINSLNLIPVGKTANSTAGGIIEVYQYLIDLFLPNDMMVRNLLVTGNSHLNSCDALIGMDVICRGDFAVSNTDGKTHFSFCMPPHHNKLCLYERADKYNK